MSAMLESMRQKLIFSPFFLLDNTKHISNNPLMFVCKSLFKKKKEGVLTRLKNKINSGHYL